MFRQKQTNMERVLLSAVAAVLLLTTRAYSAILSDSLLTTATPLMSNSSANITNGMLNNSVTEGPVVLRAFRSCESKHKNYCANGGECMYPQKGEHKPFCICPKSFEGPRCHFISDATQSLPEFEKLIGIILGVVMIVLILAIIIYCFVHSRLMKKAQLIESAASETSV